MSSEEKVSTSSVILGKIEITIYQNKYPAAKFIGFERPFAWRDITRGRVAMIRAANAKRREWSNQELDRRAKAEKLAKEQPKAQAAESA